MISLDNNINIDIEDYINNVLAKELADVVGETFNQESLDKIKDVIGKGGETINKIIDETGGKIDIEEDGRVFIYTESAEKAAKVVKTMEEQRSVLGTTPRVIDIREETYRSARKVHTTSDNTTYTYNAGDAGPIEVQYRGVALDESGNPILDGATPPDASINSSHRDHNNKAGQHYTYESDTKEGYRGLTDDAYPWAGGGGPGGPPPRP